jgi:hypothetical protein
VVNDRGDHSRGLKIAGRGFSCPRVADELELDLLPLGEALPSCTLDGRNMHEYVRVAAVGLDEAEALGGVEPFHCSDVHDDFPSIAQ